MPAFRDLTGLKFSRVTVIKFSHMRNGAAHWICQCDCGNKITINRGNLVNNTTRSCGCLRRETMRKVGKETNKNGENNPAYKHGMRRTRFYGTWCNIQHRCNNEKDARYKDYGGRGIRIEWPSFEEFKADMYAAYIEHKKTHSSTTIERNDVDGNYSRTNCRWATNKEQRNNQRPFTEENKKKIARKISVAMMGNTNAHGRLGRKYPQNKNI